MQVNGVTLIVSTTFTFPSTAGLSVDSGAMGTSVTISGSNLLDGGGNGVVTFNGAPATILSQTGSSIQVSVPAGATSGRVLGKVNGVTAIASTNFTGVPLS